MATSTRNQDSIDLVTTLTDAVWNDRDYDRVEELVHENFVQHGPATGVELSGRAALAENVRQYHEAFSDLVSAVDLVFADADGEFVAAYLTISGTHDGELMGMAPTHFEGEINASTIHRIEDGRIAETWVVADMLGLFNQLGSVPETGPFAA